MTPTRFSAKANSATPPSDDNRPPSKAAITFFGLMAGKGNGNSVSSSMADVAG
jgi:hypothetical protein